MHLIMEEIENVRFITEEKGGKKSHYVTGRFLAADCVNRNRRCYESRILDPVVNRYIKESLDKGRAVGECGHPSSPSINLDRVSHKFTELYKEGSNWMGKAKLLETPMGRVASALLNDGVTLGMSSRGMGSLEERNGVNYVKEDFMLSTVGDLVADPSGPECFVTGLYEGKEWIYDNGILTEIDAKGMKRRIDDSVKGGCLQEQMLNEFARFLLG